MMHFGQHQASSAALAEVIRRWKTVISSKKGLISHFHSTPIYYSGVSVAPKVPSPSPLSLLSLPGWSRSLLLRGATWPPSPPTHIAACPRLPGRTRTAGQLEQMNSEHLASRPLVTSGCHSNTAYQPLLNQLSFHLIGQFQKAHPSYTVLPRQRQSPAQVCSYQQFSEIPELL